MLELLSAAALVLSLSLGATDAPMQAEGEVPIIIQGGNSTESSEADESERPIIVQGGG